MRPLTARVPWSELSALAAAYVAIVAWSAVNQRPDLEQVVTALLALACALVPRRAAKGPSPAATEGAMILGALSAIAIAATAAGARPPTPSLQFVHAIATGEVLGLATMLAVAQPMRTDTLRRAAVPGVLVTAMALVGLWPRVIDPFPGARALSAVAAWVTALFFAYAVRSPLRPVDRARLIAPGLGAAAVATALTVGMLWARHVSPLVQALGLLALTVGATMGSGAIALDEASALARRCAALAASLAVGAFVAYATPEMPAAGVVAAIITAIVALPRWERTLRPDQGRLLAACDEVELALSRAQTLSDLAAAVLDPLRGAARNLRAPASLWVLDRAEMLRVDVAGGASTRQMSLESERVILSWLRSRAGVLFADALRPHLVRRAELRPVVDALDAHGALGALALWEERKLLGVVILPRGRRDEVPTWEEEVRLERMSRAVTGALSRLSALERARERERVAMRDAEQSSAAQLRAELEVDRLTDRDLGVRATQELAEVDDAWAAYSPAMRHLDAQITPWIHATDPVALVTEPHAGARAVARRMHREGPRARGPFVALDAGSVPTRDALAALVGDEREAQRRPGCLEHATGGTLFLEDVPALGHDALVALLDAIAQGRARRLGATEAYPVDVRVVVSLRRVPWEHDLPGGLIERLRETTARVPPLRERRDDIESLALLAVDRACRVSGRAMLGLAPDALVAMRTHGWPGNLVELFDAVEQSVARTRGTRIALEALPPAVRAQVAATRDDATQDFDDDVGPYHDA